MIGTFLAGHFRGMPRMSLALDQTAAGCAAETDKARLERMIGAHLDFVWRQLARAGVAESGLEDAAQQVFVVASRKLADIDRGDERGFLYGTAVRVASTWRRSLKRRRETGDDELESMPSCGIAPEDLLDQCRVRALLDRLLQEMPEELREVYVLAELEELPVPEIARIQRVPVGTAASRLRRAREEFRARLNRWKARTGAKGGPP